MTPVLERLKGMVESYTLHGDFLLPSLAETKWYFDPRPALANRHFIDAAIDSFQETGALDGVRGVAGITWCPPSLALAQAIAQRFDLPLTLLYLPHRPPMPTSHRAADMVGPLPPPGSIVFVPCDIVVTGKATLVALELLQAHGMKPRCGVIIDRGTEGFHRAVREVKWDFKALFHWGAFKEFQDESRLQLDRVLEQQKQVAKLYPTPSTATIPLPVAELSLRELQAIDLALDVAKRSTPEPGKTTPTPKVGCVVIQGDNILAVTHRNQDGGGMHAEEYALKVLLANTDLHGATLVTTLEPCTQRPKQTCCFELIQKAGIQRLIIGTSDADRSILGTGEPLTLAGKRIQLCRFPPSKIQAAWELNEDFMRHRMLAWRTA